MKTTPLMFTAALLLTGCLEPNRHAGAEVMGETEGEFETDSGDPAEGDDEVDADAGDETGDDETGSDASGGETDGPEEPGCDPETHQCVDLLPSGWNGPARIADGTEACGDAYPVESQTLLEDAFAAPAQCSCECGEPTGGSCSAHATDYPEMCLFDDCTNIDACETANDTVVLTDSWELDYNEDVAWGVDVSFIVSPPEVVSEGECASEPSSYSEVLPEVELTGLRRLCELDEPFESCEGASMCVPAGDDRFEPGICIWTHGDEVCPDGGFTERTVIFSRVLDTRACGTCECGEATGGSCDDAQITVNTFPLGDYADFTPDGECHTVNVPGSAFAQAIKLEPKAPSGGSCEATRDPYGHVEADSPLTICCTPQ